MGRTGATALLLLVGAALLARSEARVNATGAIAVFLIYDCAECTKDKNSGFCMEADSDSNFVQNKTMRVTIAQKKNDPRYSANGVDKLGPVDGAKYCWEGTFGTLKNLVIVQQDMPALADVNITATLGCASDKTYYRNCFIAAQTAIILMVVGSIVFIGGTTLLLLCCGCCKCCNEKGDDSKYGCCNRFCPWCYICADKHLRVVEKKVEIDVEERSLTGKNAKLNSAYDKVLSEKTESGGFGSSNPLHGMSK